MHRQQAAEAVRSDPCALLHLGLALCELYFSLQVDSLDSQHKRGSLQARLAAGTAHLWSTPAERLHRAASDRSILARWACQNAGSRPSHSSVAHTGCLQESQARPGSLTQEHTAAPVEVCTCSSERATCQSMRQADLALHTEASWPRLKCSSPEALAGSQVRSHALSPA